jgi:hypothetical protein
MFGGTPLILVSMLAAVRFERSGYFLPGVSLWQDKSQAGCGGGGVAHARRVHLAHLAGGCLAVFTDARFALGTAMGVHARVLVWLWLGHIRLPRQIRNTSGRQFCQ